MTLSNRVSACLSYSEALRLREAALFAHCDGKPLNVFISIHLDQLGVTDAQALLGTFLKRAGDWLRKRMGLPPAYIWVLENPLLGGLHAHILIHVPSPLRRDFDCLMRGWLVGKGNPAPSRAVHRRTVRYSGLNAPVELYLRRGLLGALRYMLKGIAVDAAGGFGVDPKAQGVALGKRSGYAEALGAQHRWKRLPVAGQPKAWVGGPSCKMRRSALHLVPELFGLAD
jgi:hypothetical protein